MAKKPSATSSVAGFGVHTTCLPSVLSCVGAWAGVGGTMGEELATAGRLTRCVDQTLDQKVDLAAVKTCSR